MSTKLSVPVLTNAAATGSPVVIGTGGLYAFSVIGTFSGATVKLQMLGPDGATYIDIDSALSFTAAGVYGVDLPAGATVKGVISGGPPTGINATLGLVR